VQRLLLAPRQRSQDDRLHGVEAGRFGYGADDGGRIAGEGVGKDVAASTSNWGLEAEVVVAGDLEPLIVNLA